MSEKKKFKIKKGDQVVVLTGKDRGKKGEVLKILTQKDRAIVSGVNVAKKHQRPSNTSAGGITDKERSIHISNLSLLDPESGKPTRVGYKVLESGEKIRVATRSGQTLA